MGREPNVSEYAWPQSQFTAEHSGEPDPAYVIDSESKGFRGKGAVRATGAGSGSPFEWRSWLKTSYLAQLLPGFDYGPSTYQLGDLEQVS